MVRKKDLLNRIEFLNSRLNAVESSNKLLLEMLTKTNEKVSGLESANETLLEMVTKMNEKVTFLWNQDQYKKEDMDSILDEWVNGAREEGED